MGALDSRENADLTFKVLLQLLIQVPLLDDLASHPLLLVVHARHSGSIGTILGDQSFA